LIRESENLLQAAEQSIITGLTRAVVVFFIEAREYIAESIGTGGKLDEKRTEQIATGLLVDISEVKVKISHRDQSRAVPRCDLIYDCGAAR